MKKERLQERPEREMRVHAAKAFGIRLKEGDMVHMTLEVSEELAERIRPLEDWLPTVLELSLSGFHTIAIATATEVIQFLSNNPSPQDVLDYHASERAQARLQRLLALNEAGILSEEERQELDELQRVEHIIVLLKAHVAKQLVPEG